MPREHHVVHFINSFAEGGTERQAIQLVNALHLGGEWRVSVSAHSSAGPLLQMLAPELRERLAIYPLRRFASWHTVRQLRAFGAHLRRVGADIVHTHGFYPNTFGTCAARLAGVAVRIASKREERALRTTPRAALEGLALARATHIVANCGAIRAQLHERGFGVGRISTIHNAVAPERTPAVYRTAAAIATDVATDVAPVAGESHLITMVANFHHDAKDHATFLRAARRVVDAAPETRFTLAGEGPHRLAIQRLCTSLGLSDHVCFTGYCAEIPSLLARSTVCVLTSRSEGSPNAVLEYMAAGRPVVATDVGGVSETVIDGVTGILVRPGDDASIAAAILRLLSDGALRKRMGAAASARVREEFSLVRQLDAVSALYRSELARATRTSR